MNGRMKFRRTFALNAELNCNSKEWELVLGYWGGGMGWLGAFTLASLRMIVFRIERFRQKSSGV